ncbi:hypothetical protein BDC45DRAFT_536787 [Circinella umbellata]|nr:hypothetical protein BDC45DRAFT_536787 [Circinella umbellata]
MMVPKKNDDNNKNSTPSVELSGIIETDQFSEFMISTRRNEEYAAWIEKASLLPPLSEAIRDMGFWVYASNPPKRKNVNQNTRATLTAEERHKINITIFKELCFQYEHLRNSIIIYHNILRHYHMKEEQIGVRGKLIEKMCSLTKSAYNLLNDMVQTFYILLEETHMDDANLIKEIFFDQDETSAENTSTCCSSHQDLDMDDMTIDYRNSDLNNLIAHCKEELGHYEEHFLRLVDFAIYSRPLVIYKYDIYKKEIE